MNLLTDLTGLIAVWAMDKDLDKADPAKQMLKLAEEHGELAAALARSDQDKIIDSIGDMYVVLVVLTKQLGLDIEDCIEQAYEEIKGRQGRMVNGVFVKQEDLHD